MISRVRRALAGRPARKFLRNRLAVAALAVIVLYVAIAVLIFAADTARTLGSATGWWSVSPDGWVDFFSQRRADAEVGPFERPGFARTQRPEKRLQDANFYLDQFRKALRQRDKEAALARIRFGELRPADIPLDELRDRLSTARDLYDELAQSPDLDADPKVAVGLGELEAQVASLFRPMTSSERLRHAIALSLGTDRDGRSIFLRALYSIKVAIQVGFVVGLLSVVIGALLGAAAAFFSGWVDHVVVWLYSTLSSLPDLVLLAVLVFMFTGSIFDDVTKPWLSLVPLYTAMCATFWIGPCRVIRGEIFKIKQLEYVQAATAVGFPRLYILLKHALPNTAHLMFISFSLLFIAAIKNEVVLTFLGLGVKSGPSWGRMIQESTPQVINGFFWQIGAATAFMFFLVLAFNIVSDALQDAFDPRHVG